jgi:bifunctional non-homologous end joining protein LigD
MADGLSSYRRKRDFGATPEPAGERDADESGAPRFVVQEHHARRLHWDLRLERDGVLASWAVPNGIPETPQESRKAVHTEDHPLEYLDFEGDIPAGQYGAGSMRVWDQGTYECNSWGERKVVVTFHGERLRGRYALYATGGDRDWMIHRMDPPERPLEAMPEQVLPMLAADGALPADDGGHAYEVLWPGLRALVHSQPGRLRLQGAGLEDLTERYPELRPLNRALGSRSALLDGVLVAFDGDGRPSRERIERRAAQPPRSARRAAESTPVLYVVFDLLHLDGESLAERPYEERRALLEELDLRGDAWGTPPAERGDGEGWLRAALERGLPGVVAKRLDSPYRPGQRSDAWLAVRAEGAEPEADAPAHGLLGEGIGPALERGRQLGRDNVEVEVEGRKLRLSNLDKVLYPRAGFTKRDVIDYYARIAPVLLPHLRERPLTLKRYPNGVEGGHFYQKQCPKHRPDWVRTAAVWSRHNKDEIEYCLGSDRPTLVWAANLADLELHTSLSLTDDIERPTALVFDLDPGPPADIVQCCEVGLALRALFERVGLEAFAKTSGSKGLQVYVPLNRPVTYDDTKPFARAVAEAVEQTYPELVVSRMTKSVRGGKILIDWSQNDEHKTTVCVYSLRAREQPTVSTPVTWDEVERAHERGDAGLLRFTSEEVLRRVERHGDLFAPLLSIVQELPSGAA